MVTFWVALLAISILLYVLLDGFDLGIGILFGFSRSDARRDAMVNAVAPVWDGNETWLVVTAVILWGAFPLVYSVLLSAFYLPLLIMLAGLILRGVAFEYRHRAKRSRWVWDWSFAGGSLAATFMQGLTVGALVRGLPVVDGHYAGGALGWLTPFSLLCGVGLCLGYSLLGAAWLIQKCEGEIREIAYRQTTWLALGVLVFLLMVFAYALADHLQIMDRWLERPYLFIFPVIGALAAGVLGASIRYHWDGLPFAMVVLIFLAAFGTLAISFWPYMIPFAITVDEGAAPPSSLAFMMWGEGLFVFPLMLIYNVIAYSVFRGKVAASSHHY